MGVWVFICAGLYAVWEKVADKYFPGFLDIEAEGASQAPAPVRGRRRREEGLRALDQARVYGARPSGRALIHFPAPSRR